MVRVSTRPGSSYRRLLQAGRRARAASDRERWKRSWRVMAGEVLPDRGGTAELEFPDLGFRRGRHGLETLEALARDDGGAPVGVGRDAEPAAVRPVDRPLHRQVGGRRVLEIELDAQVAVARLGADVDHHELGLQVAVTDELLLLAGLVAGIGVRRHSARWLGGAGGGERRCDQGQQETPLVHGLHGVLDCWSVGGVPATRSTGFPPITCGWSRVPIVRAKTSMVSPGSSSKVPRSIDSPPTASRVNVRTPGGTNMRQAWKLSGRVSQARRSARSVTKVKRSPAMSPHSSYFFSSCCVSSRLRSPRATDLAAIQSSRSWRFSLAIFVTLSTRSVRTDEPLLASIRRSAETGCCRSA